MNGRSRNHSFRPHLWLIRLIGVIVPRRLRADWRQEWEAELRFREEMLAEWDRLDWRNKLDVLGRSLGAFRDALLLQPRRLEDEMFQDIRYGARMALKHKGFTVVAALSLALGIGANTAIFSLIDAVLLKTLPVERPEQLYFIHNVGARRSNGGAPPYPCFEIFRDRNQSFTGLAAFSGFGQRMRIDGQFEQVSGQIVSGNFFSLLGINAALGRTFGPADDTAPGKGGPDGLLAVISYNYWTNRFGRDPSVIGKVLRLNDDPVTIIGVAPRRFYGLVPGSNPDIWLPMMTAGAERLASKETWWLDAVGRVKTGAPVEQARAELDTIFQSYMDGTGINAEARREAFNRIDLRPAGRGLNELRRQFSQPLQALMAIVALTLLIACANVANLLLARSTARRKEFAVRLALGASRLRLLRQLLTESLLLVTLGGLLGLLFARWGSAFLVSFFNTGRGRIFVNLPLDYRVLSFTAAVALLTGLIFGLAPALQATRIELNSALKDSAGAGARARSRFGKGVVVAQVALSLLLLVGAGLFVRTLRNLKTIDAGFSAEGVLTMSVNPPDGAYEGERLIGLWKDMLARVERLPGVRSACLTTLSPLGRADRGVGIDVAGFSPVSDRDKSIRLNQISPGYFQTFGVPIAQGKSFTDAENGTAPRVALLNEAAARFYFGDRSPLGAQVRIPRGEQPSPPYEIVGVVKDARNRNLREADARTIYMPITQARDRLGRLTLAVRAEGKPTELTGAISNELRAIDPDIFLTNIVTLNEQVDQSLLQERLVATLSLFFGLLALSLACLGLYGVMSYDVARRTREIGVRMALGASAQRVVGLVMRQTLLWVAFGVVIGLGSTLATTRWVESLLFGLKPNDPLTIGAAALTLLAVAAVAGYLPARRAARVDPLAALRHD
ncbi:MAG TPA: ABC transporter permease [Blastocatellia bacterium]|nr:ABC transporter permease [Blastocatellia bacterium]